jgi:hypothetical protein
VSAPLDLALCARCGQPLSLSEALSPEPVHPHCRYDRLERLRHKADITQTASEMLTGENSERARLEAILLRAEIAKVERDQAALEEAVATTREGPRQ